MLLMTRFSMCIDDKVEHSNWKIKSIYKSFLNIDESDILCDKYFYSFFFLAEAKNISTKLFSFFFKMQNKKKKMVKYETKNNSKDNNKKNGKKRQILEK